MSRADTITEPAWRAHVVRPDGSVRCEFRSKDGTGHDCRAWFGSVELQPGEKAFYQIRHAGRSRFLTFGRRP